jgi:hypothetical protein
VRVNGELLERKVAAPPQNKLTIYLWGCSGTKPTVNAAIIGLLNQSWIDGDDCGAISEMNEWQGKPKYPEKTCPNVALSCAVPHNFLRT